METRHLTLHRRGPATRAKTSATISQRNRMLNDEVAPVVSQAEALVLQQPTERAFDRPAVSAQPGAMRASALVDERLDLAGMAELTVPFGIITLCRHRPCECAP